MAEMVSLERPRLRVLLGRAMRLRCPRCGVGPIYASGLAMFERCRACRLRDEREQGYFVGAVYVNCAITVVVVLGGVLALDHLLGLSLAAQLTINRAADDASAPLPPSCSEPVACARLSGRFA